MTDELVAERDYWTADGEALKVSFFKPRRAEVDWVCDFAFEGAISQRKQSFGVDAVQALYLAMQHVSSVLYTHQPDVHWFNPGDELGLPTVSAIDDLRLARTQGVSQ